MKFIAVSLLLLLPSVLGATPTTEIQDGQTGTLMVLPPQATETGLRRIPGIYSLDDGKQTLTSII
jgi:hypothetical protein